MTRILLNTNHYRWRIPRTLWEPSLMCTSRQITSLFQGMIHQNIVDQSEHCYRFSRLSVIQALLSHGIITHAQYMSFIYMKNIISQHKSNQGSVKVLTYQKCIDQSEYISLFRLRLAASTVTVMVTLLTMRSQQRMTR